MKYSISILKEEELAEISSQDPLARIRDLQSPRKNEVFSLGGITADDFIEIFEHLIDLERRKFRGQAGGQTKSKT